MEYSDTTVIIPVKDEPSAGRVAYAALDALPKCKVIVIYKGRLRIKKRKNLMVIKQSSSGKGAGCIEAVKRSNTEIICFIDGDNTYDARDLRKVVAQVRNGASLALGDRLDGLSTDVMPPLLQVGNRMLTLAANVLYGMDIRDSCTGLRAIRRKVFDEINIQEMGFGIEPEMNIKVRRKGLKIVETRINYYKREEGIEQQHKVQGAIKVFISPILTSLLYR